MTNKRVKKNISNQSDISLGGRIRELRTSKLQTDQKNFARLLGVSQATVSQWERGDYLPSAMALIAISNLAGGDKAWWLQQAGADYAETERTVDAFRSIHRVDEEENATILVYGEVGAGPFRYIPEEAVDKVSLPRSWFHATAQIVGLIVRGDSMSPLIQSGFIAFADRSKTQWADCAGKIVAVGDGEGLTLKWLEKAGRGYVLVPNNRSAENQSITVGPHHKIFGQVNRWIGINPTPKNSEVRFYI